MEEIIREVIRGVPRGKVFDSHYVIQELLRREDGTDAYIVFGADYATSARPTLTAHQQIGHLIAGLRDLARRVPDTQSWSMTIHGMPGECALWQRI